MANEADRISRAGNYVMGLMNEAERERAERDLERDALFREAVLSVAERMRIIGAPPEPKSGPDDRWKIVSSRIAELPQMRGSLPVTAAEDEPAARTEPQAGRAVPAPWRGPQSVPSLRAAVMAACLIAVFALGYAAGTLSPGLFSGTAMTDTASRTEPP